MIVTESALDKKALVSDLTEMRETLESWMSCSVTKDEDETLMTLYDQIAETMTGFGWTDPDSE